LGATTGIIGAMQAIETIKLLVGIEETLKGRLMICDFRDMYFTTIDIVQRPDCPVCQGGEIAARKGLERLAWLCGRNTVNVNPPKPMDVILAKAYEKLEEDF
ncbi:MAG: hypothetical protein GWO20_18435, partial [Candidatus Korarchaeota archaeon]|nr:hypothetical protein [Candidatus Korarchaeota archaeon]